MTGDTITLTIPAEEGFDRIAHLVLGGLAVRLDVTFEHLEDLHLALDPLLEERDEGETTVSVTISGDELETSVGPFPRGYLVAQLDRETDGIGLRRVLATLVDDFEVADRDGEEWIELRKHVERVKRHG